MFMLKRKMRSLLKLLWKLGIEKRLKSKLRKELNTTRSFLIKNLVILRLKNKRKDGLVAHQRMNFYLTGDVLWRRLQL
ncbi:hypothetical protein SDC9_202257 [bioreactor metagenome]|uniref:Uncharacterized protein n=1 Tax=bioreactor metagenome TaxID=1076179 RepID=A0A645ITU1_9ZZZZ